MTNILALPLLTADVRISNNTDWRDTWPFVVAGDALAFARLGNAGNGSFGAIYTDPGAPIGNSIITIVEAAGTDRIFSLTDPNGNFVAKGTVGIPFVGGGFKFLFPSGTVPFDVGDVFTIAVLPRPLDITGITFRLAVRLQAGDPNIVFLGSTEDGMLINGGQSGVLSSAVPYRLVRLMPPSTCVFDCIAEADGVVQPAISGTLSISLGIANPRTIV